MRQSYRLLLLLTLFSARGEATEVACPERVLTATRLLAVVAPNMKANTATVQMFERPSGNASWNKIGGPKHAVLGRSGLGWAWDQTELAAQGEPSKHEGDGRTPAGVFGIGHNFGFSPERPGAGYLRLRAGETYCVDDPNSRAYNRIVPKSEAGAGVSGEDMATISLYRRGLLISFPTNSEKKGGSCIFIHVWRSPVSPTSGCVALHEGDVLEIQRWAAEESTLVAILSKNALARSAGCFPRL
jgi:L,D-peptidoglycan transpeptidase YkuD (ErfK/YbiS/YcfS/YnhG family)